MRKILLFWKLSAPGKKIFLEVFFLSIYTAFLLRNDRNHHKIKAILGRPPAANDADAQPGPEERRTVTLAGSAIQTVAKYTPWRNVCYHQALQARLLLGRRGIPLNVYIGFRKNAQGKIEGHAWTTCRGRMITGFCNADEYTVLSEFQ